MAALKEKKIVKLISFIIVCVSIIWILYSFHKDSEKITRIIQSFKAESLFFILTTGLVASFLNSVVFTILINKYSSSFSFFESSNLFFSGQIIRHLPGRIWSILYQINKTRQRIKPDDMIFVNIDFFIVTIGFATSIPLSVLIYMKNPFAGFLFFIFMTLGINFLLQAKFHNYFLSAIIKKFLLKPDFHNDLNYITYSYTDLIKINCTLMISWILYFYAWKLIGHAFNDFNNIDMIMLCANYSLAWLAGFFSFFTVSGIGIREAIFVTVSNGLNSVGVLAMLAIIIRFWLLFNDIFLFLVFTSINIVVFRKKNVQNQ